MTDDFWDLAADPAPTRRQARLERTRNAHRSTTRSLGLTALSTLLPGAGLVFTRRRAVGLAYLGATLAFSLALGIWLWQAGVVDAALSLAASPRTLWVLMGAVAALALLWIASIIATSRYTRPAGLPATMRLVHLAFTVLMCLVIAMPATATVRAVMAHQKAVKQIFASSGDGGEEHRASAIEDTEWGGRERLNVMLLGSDAGEGRRNLRPDTIMVASINTSTGKTVLFSLPRNLQGAPIRPDSPLRPFYPDGVFICPTPGNECMLSRLWEESTNPDPPYHGAAFGEEGSPTTPLMQSSGLRSTREAVEDILGLRVDHTVMVNLAGFQEFVDAMGGITINVKGGGPNGTDPLPMGGKAKNGQVIGIDENTEWLQPGDNQHLDGRHALWYARSRATTDDFHRMDRQRCVVGAIVDQLDATTILTRYPAIASAVGNNVVSDFNEGELRAYVRLLERIQTGGIRSLPFNEKNMGTTVRPDIEKIQRRVQLAIEPPEPTAKPTPATTSPQPTPSTTAPATTEPVPSATPTTDPTAEPTVDESADLASTC